MMHVQALLSILLALLPTATSAAMPVWPDTFIARVEALALLQSLNANLLSHDSATLVLERWCGAHRLATVPRIVAQKIPAAPRPPTEEQRQRLRVGPTEPVRFRHVRLACGSLVLAEADNWYLPARLTPEMNRLLETTDAPFGSVVKSLHFQRRTLAARLLWLPLPPDWELAAAPVAPRGAKLVVPGAVLEHRALLTLADGTPFSEVVETYSGNVLAFAAPPAPGPAADLSALAGRH